MDRMHALLNGKDSNHLLPFLWMHGEDETTLRHYIKKINNSGIRAVCLEARPHPDFLGSGWWRDLDIILDEAGKLDMKIWILDDEHFPTGYANGEVERNYPHLRKRLLKCHQLDFCGPRRHAQAMISYAFEDSDDKLIGVWLARKTGFNSIDFDSVVNITDKVHDNRLVSFNLPEGEWKIITLVSSYKGGEKETEGYLNPLLPEATDVLINTVYEPHYQHYAGEFGRTILGFFSDEPRFGNLHGASASIGRDPMPLPWREDLPELLAERSISGTQGTEDIKNLLPLLFINAEESANLIRYHYMDLVSELYSVNFSQRIADWCSAHHIEHIGHVIEDNNASGRLGYGAGHFFRSMKGQSMAGLDVVLHQLLPGMDHSCNKSMTAKGWDGEFFHYCLGKLGGSLGDLDPTMNGRVMCEVYGAYGWSEGNRLMKWISDYMLVRGVNEFCPHAFDPKEYPDEDCPPHFYAHGINPQYREFEKLMRYTNRIAELVSGGSHIATAAVLYHAEAEWSGEYMPMQKVCAELTRNQIDFDIVAVDYIDEADIRTEEIPEFRINGHDFKCLIIPAAEALPEALIRKAAEMADSGIPVYFLERLPERSSELTDVKEVLNKLVQSAVILKIDELIPEMQSKGLYEITASTYEPYLRAYQYKHEDGDVLMLVNEAPAGVIKTEISVPFQRSAYRYDAFDNRLIKVPNQEFSDRKINLELNAYQSAVFCWTDHNLDNLTSEERAVPSVENEITGPFKVSFADSSNLEFFTGEMTLAELLPINELDGRENFSGLIRYDFDVNIDDPDQTVFIEINEVSESAALTVNGSEAGVKICPPYLFDISDLVVKGKNQLSVTASTTLGRTQQDWLSQYLLMEPAGITDSITLKTER